MDKKQFMHCLTEDGPLCAHRWSRLAPYREMVPRIEHLWEISNETALAFLDASPSVLSYLAKQEASEWEYSGRIMWPIPPDSCGAASELSMASLNSYRSWLERGVEMARLSMDLASQFFRFTPIFLKNGDMFRVNQWADLGVQLLTALGASEEPARVFLRSSPEMLRLMGFKDFGDWHALGLYFAKKSSVLASAYFHLTSQEFDGLERSERVEMLRLASILAETDPEGAIGFMKSFIDRLMEVNPVIRDKVLSVAKLLSSDQPEKLPAALSEVVSALSPFSHPTQRLVMEQGAAIWAISSNAFKGYLLNVKRLLGEMPEFFLPHWVAKGLSLLRKDIREGMRYFSMESDEPIREIERWKDAVFLEDHRYLLSLFARALTGEKMTLKSTDELHLRDKRDARHYPTSDGAVIYLPPFSLGGRGRRENFLQYKVATAHQAGYVEFGTFQSGLHVIKAMLESLPFKELALDLFFILEDGRVDHRLKEEYAGLRKEIDLVLEEAMARRRSPAGLPPLEALVESLLRLTAGHLDTGLIPGHLMEPVAFLIDTLAGFYETAQGTWDCFFKALEIYDFLSPLAKEAPYVPHAPIFFRGKLDFDLLPGAIPGDRPGSDQDKLAEEDSPTLSADGLENLLEMVKDPSKLKILKGRGLLSQKLFLTDRELSQAEDQSEELNGDDSAGRDFPRIVTGSRSAWREGPFYYDEWDYLQGAYRRRWCRLTESSIEPTETSIIEHVYEDYDEVISLVRKQFLRIRPQILEVVRRVEWGDEIDLNEVVQGVVDRKAGDTPSDRIFVRREKRLRKISTLLLVDMSASTSEPVPSTDDSSARKRSAHPAEGFPPERSMNREKKIIDIEIESLVVMMEALNSLGDDFAIYGFSGYGRESVDYYRIKDFSEPYSETLKKRIGGIQPKMSTRMGPAIRHSIEKLKPIDSDQRLLILLSDGFPQDHDYGEDRRSKEYALQDTMVALMEAKREGIRPFCITVDQAGNDYLRRMCDPRSYLVVNDVYTLPETLPKVVESLMGS